MSGFKKGDPVSVAGTGEPGVVENTVPERVGTYVVRMQSGYILYLGGCNLTLRTPEPAPISGEVLDPWACPKVDRKPMKIQLHLVGKMPSRFISGLKPIYPSDDLQSQIDDLRQEMEEECEFRDKRINALSNLVAELDKRLAFLNGATSKREAELFATLDAVRDEWSHKWAWRKSGRGADTAVVVYATRRDFNLHSVLESRQLPLTPHRADANMPHATRTIPQSSTPYFSPTFDSL